MSLAPVRRTLPSSEPILSQEAARFELMNQRSVVTTRQETQ
jgi:hypothetical protein